MAAPSFVQAGTGTAILTGTGTVSITGTTAGNMLFLYLVQRGTAYQATFSSHTNIEALDGTATSMTAVLGGGNLGNPQTSVQALYICRSTVGGTCSVDIAVGAGDYDVFARWYEFTNCSTGTTLAAVLENTDGDGIKRQAAATSTTLADANVATTGADRLATNFIGLDNAQALTAFTGMTGGTWAEDAEYQDATGATATLQLQTASIPTAGLIQQGTETITSAGYGIVGTAILPSAAPGEYTLHVVRSQLRW